MPLRPLLMTSAFATLLLADENLPAPILDAASADDVQALPSLNVSKDAIEHVPGGSLSGAWSSA